MPPKSNVPCFHCSVSKKNGRSVANTVTLVTSSAYALPGGVSITCFSY